MSILFWYKGIVGLSELRVAFQGLIGNLLPQRGFVKKRNKTDDREVPCKYKW